MKFYIYFQILSEFLNYRQEDEDSKLGNCGLHPATTEDRNTVSEDAAAASTSKASVSNSASVSNPTPRRRFQRNSRSRLNAQNSQQPITLARVKARARVAHLFFFFQEFFLLFFSFSTLARPQRALFFSFSKQVNLLNIKKNHYFFSFF